MPRIRTIKPEFPQSESIGAVSRDARLLFVQLWTICDDYGRCRANVRLLAGQLYPYDVDAVTLLPGWLAELEAGGLVAVYQVDGSTYLEVLGWSKHQRVDNAGKSSIPPRPEGQANPVAEVRRESPRVAATVRESPLDLGPRTLDLGEEGEGEPEGAAVAARPQAIDPMACPIEEIVAAYHDGLPSSPEIIKITKTRASHIRARWRDAAKMQVHPFGYSDRESGIRAWREFFAICAQSEFLTGRVPPKDGKRPFFADLDWLMTESNFLKVLENRYHRSVA